MSAHPENYGAKVTVGVPRPRGNREVNSVLISAIMWRLSVLSGILLLLVRENVPKVLCHFNISYGISVGPSGRVPNFVFFFKRTLNGQVGTRAMEVMRAGSLKKRGTHISDEFHFRCHLAHFYLLYAWFLCADFSGNLLGLRVLSNLCRTGMSAYGRRVSATH